MLSCLQSNLRTCLAQWDPGALLGTKITHRQRDGSAKQLLNRVLKLAKTSLDYSDNVFKCAVLVCLKLEALQHFSGLGFLFAFEFNRQRDRTLEDRDRRTVKTGSKKGEEPKKLLLRENEVSNSL